MVKFQQILYLTFMGKTRSEIANDLNLTYESVHQGQCALRRAYLLEEVPIEEADVLLAEDTEHAPSLDMSSSLLYLDNLSQDQRARYDSISTNVEQLKAHAHLSKDTLQQILYRTFRNKSTAQIAKALNIAHSTVYHGQWALRKVGILPREPVTSLVNIAENHSNPSDILVGITPLEETEYVTPQNEELPPPDTSTIPPDRIQKLTPEQIRKYLSISTNLETLKKRANLSKETFENILYLSFLDNNRDEIAIELGLSRGTICNGQCALLHVGILTPTKNPRIIEEPIYES
jgi:DNA-binding CsgD family transcriptional regulator